MNPPSLASVDESASGTDAATSAAMRILAHFESFGTFGDLCGYTQQEMDALYSVGYAHYRNARYQAAHDIFAFLVQHDHLDRRYLHALAGALQALGKYTDAIKFYGLALGYDIDDTSVIVPMAECFARSGDRATALECLDALLALHAQTPQDPALVSRAEALRSLLNADRQGERT
ncbi:hypothetical protein LV28_25450 [Pandoraea pnomenusa]|uniref:Type III secretion system chaperone protein SscB n=1 Tax=Pandoraea pnomenusa TaxID=93220 RepID=A0A378YV52_9BURK|nr:SycD/LcrH family type III secretion system chaperone [Pandoraea pnomenusa]ALR36065.1 hypothetical protein LV28_25450 [Pandoraea pnomenusa]SUA80688.1 type III secretion system chaperone protein SscB [Pandoraea pnomenusa]